MFGFTEAVSRYRPAGASAALAIFARMGGHAGSRAGRWPGAGAPALLARIGVAVAVLAPVVLPHGAAAQVASRIRVDIREAGADRPLADVEIEVVGVGERARTGGDGRAVLTGIPPGRHTLRASHMAYEPVETVIEVENGLTTDVVLRLQPRPLALRGLDVAVQGLPSGARAVAVETLGPEARTVGDVVESVPGVSVVRRGGPGSPAVPSIRGSSGDQVLVLVDGVAINSPMTGEADLAELDLAHVERVVVVPGSRAGRFGPRALAGAILITTRSPRSSTLEASLEGGTLRAWGVGATGTLARPGGAWAASAGGEWRRSDGAFEYPVPAVRGGGSTSRENAQSRVASGYAQVVWDAGHAPRLRLRVHGRDAERGSPGSIVQPSLTGRHEQRRVGAVAQADGGSGARGWQAIVGGDEHRALFVDPEPPFGPPYRSESRVRQIEARAETRTPAGPVELGGGADGRYRGIEANTLAEGAPRGIGGVGAWLRGRWSADLESARGVELTAIVRADAHDLLADVILSPSASILLGTGATTLEAVVGSSVSPPDISDLFFQEGVLAEANPDLAPERVRGEVSGELRRRFGGDGWDGELSVGAFRADVNGMILWFPDHRFVWSPENVDVRRWGVETSGALRVGPTASLRGDLSWTRVEYDVESLEGQVVYRPALTAHVGGGLSLAGVDWSAQWRWVGPRRTSPGTDLNRLSGYGRFDVGAEVAYRLGAVSGSVEVSADNVFDESAALLVDYPLPGRTLSIRIRAGPRNP